MINLAKKCSWAIGDIMHGKIPKECLDRKVSVRDLLNGAKELQSEGDNPEYDRGMAEIISDIIPSKDAGHGGKSVGIANYLDMKTTKRWY